MPSIDLSTAEFVVETMRKLEDLGDSVTDTDSTHIARIEVAHGEETVGYFLHEGGSWAYQPTGEASDDEDDDASDDEDDEDDEDTEASDDAAEDDASDEVEDEDEDVDEDDEDVEDDDEGSEGSGESRGFRR
jgi:hypothetical protein